VRAEPTPGQTKGRLDQWLWFARLVKSRSGAARLCASGLVAVNGNPVRKPSHTIRVGDTVVVPQGTVQRTARVVTIGHRRGPAVEARLLYEEIAAATPLAALVPRWLPLLDEVPDYASEQDPPGPMSR
jgi:ribosome-associated heat shock protein Hsp15